MSWGKSHYQENRKNQKTFSYHDNTSLKLYLTNRTEMCATMVERDNISRLKLKPSLQMWIWQVVSVSSSKKDLKLYLTVYVRNLQFLVNLFGTSPEALNDIGETRPGYIQLQDASSSNNCSTEKSSSHEWATSFGDIVTYDIVHSDMWVDRK